VEGEHSVNPIALCAAAFALATTDPVLTLEDAKARALARHPALAAAVARVDAAQARRKDAGRLANPVLTAEVENFGATSERLESTLRLGQTFELGGDRAGRAGVADAQLALVEAERVLEARAVLAETADRFLDAWALEQRLAAFKDAETLAAEGVKAADARHRAGAALATERLRAEAQRALRTLERARAEQDLAIARRRLAAQWGDSAATFGTLSPGEEPDTTVTATFDAARARAQAEVALEDARVREARAARVPDLSLEFGVRRLAETSSTGFLAGVALPLPLWNGQGAAVEAAEADRAAASARSRTSALSFASERDAALARMATARGTRAALRDMRPAADEALRQVRAAYRAGRLGYPDLVEAQRSVREADLAEVEATIELWRARVALDRLTGEDR